MVGLEETRIKIHGERLEGNNNKRLLLEFFKLRFIMYIYTHFPENILIIIMRIIILLLWRERERGAMKSKGKM